MEFEIIINYLKEFKPNSLELKGKIENKSFTTK